MTSHYNPHEPLWKSIDWHRRAARRQRRRERAILLVLALVLALAALLWVT